MPLITLFSAPKPFVDPHISMIQRNAIESWMQLPQAEVLLLGDEHGIAGAARELGTKYLPQVQGNAAGTPLISSMIELAREHGAGQLLCIINADMILFPQFVEAAEQLMRLRQKFVALSQRWDFDIDAPIDFNAGWMNQLRESVLEQNQLHRPAGSDFFLFNRSLYESVPDFAVGRAGWDNWMIYEARRQKWPVIDCTPSLMLVHQNHDYSHLPDSRPHYDHPDSDENIRLAGGQATIRYTILDSTLQLLADGKLVRPRWSYLRFMRGVELFLRAVFFFLPENMIEDVARPKRWKKRIQKMLGNRSS